MSNRGHILVDLDGTLAHYDRWRGPQHIGAPVPAMVARVKQWLAEGKDVWIFTARVARGNEPVVVNPIHAWCQEHIGQFLPITCRKYMSAVEIWDDRAVQVEANTGRRMDGADGGHLRYRLDADSNWWGGIGNGMFYIPDADPTKIRLRPTEEGEVMTIPLDEIPKLARTLQLIAAGADIAGKEDSHGRD